MDEVIDSLVDYVNELKEREAFEDATWGQRGALEAALRDFQDALNQFSHRDWRAE